jgi:hypothetical protein
MKKLTDWQSGLLGFLGLFTFGLVAHANPATGLASHDFHWHLKTNASSFSNSDPCDLSQSQFANCFTARPSPTVRVFLIQYGNYSTPEDLKRIGALLAKRFSAATDNALQIEFVQQAVVPLPHYPRDFSEFIDTIKGEKTIERLTRLWYYYFKDVTAKDTLVTEIKEELITQGYAKVLSQADVTLVLSEPQFEGLGYATGGYGLTEQPTEIAWATRVAYTLKYSDAQIVDELLHELGHLLGLDHAAKQCYEQGSDPSKTRACCDQSAAGNDVMSYCRDRSKVSDTFYFGYTQCTRDYLKNVTAPALINGGKRPFQSAHCQ